MNECDVDRVLQIREAVRAQAHCELPAVEKLGDAIHRWAGTSEVPNLAVAMFLLTALMVGWAFGWMKGWRDHGKSSRKSS